MKGLRLVSLQVLAALSLCFYAAPLWGGTPPSEAELKAVYLFHFTQFVDWPSSSFQGADSPLIIGVVQDETFRRLVEKIALGEKVSGHPLEVKLITTAEDARLCHILYSPSGTESLVESAAIQTHAVLTVGETSSFLRNGGIIRFVSDHNRIRFRISLPAAKAASLGISSKMLRVAEVTEGGSS